MPKRTFSRRTYRRKSRKRYGGKRRKTFRKAGYSSRSQGRAVAKYTSIVRPITLKPKFQMRRLQWYNTCRIDCALVQSGQHSDLVKSTVPLWFTLRLNSPYPVLHSDTPHLIPDTNIFQNADGGTPGFHWNQPMQQHNNQSAIDQGTRYEGWDGPGSPAYGYAQYCVVGTKVTATYTPIGNVSSTTGAVPTGFFGFLHTDAENQLEQAPRSADLGPNHTTIKSIYEKPYSKVVKILPTGMATGNLTQTAHYGGGGTSGRLTFSYSPKRMNGIKDIADNATLWGALHNDGSPQFANHPAEGDYLTIGLAPLMQDVNNSNAQQDPIAPMQSGMLQIKMETVIAFREPVNATAAAGSQNVGTGLGGGGGDLAAMAGTFVGTAGRAFMG